MLYQVIVKVWDVTNKRCYSRTVFRGSQAECQDYCRLRFVRDENTTSDFRNENGRVTAYITKVSRPCGFTYRRSDSRNF